MNAAPEQDWDAIRRRIAEVDEALAHGFALSPEQERSVLKERALELGLALASEQERAHGLLEVVEFELAGESYAFPLAQVREVNRLRGLTAVPCTPAFILGIINLRGEILTIIDLKTCFDLPATAITEAHKILILHGAGTQLGVLADAIRGVRRLTPDELQPALPTLTGARADYLHGITHDCVVVLDAAKLLTDSRLVVDEEVSP